MGSGTVEPFVGLWWGGAKKGVRVNKGVDCESFSLSINWVPYQICQGDATHVKGGAFCLVTF
jgi:hypothetical protein